MTDLWDRYTAGLKGGSASDDTLRREVARGTVLDVGTGQGWHLIDLPSASRRIGVDPGFPGVRAAMDIVPDATFVCGSGAALPFRPSSFDAALCIEVIEHVEAPVAVLAEICRVLRIGGRLYLQTPNYPAKRLYDLWHTLRGRRDSFADDPTHVSRFNARSLVAAVEAAGLTPVRVLARNLPSFRLVSWGERARESPILMPLAQKVIVVAERRA